LHVIGKPEVAEHLLPRSTLRRTQQNLTCMLSLGVLMVMIVIVTIVLD
jgi:hypothetical protein